MMTAAPVLLAPTVEACENKSYDVPSATLGTPLPTYILYQKRWFVLSAFSLLTLTSAWIWITWSPLSNKMAHFWNVSEASVDALPGIYLYIYLPCSFVALWFVNSFGLRFGLVVGATFNAVGACIRWYGLWTYSHVYFGTVLCAMAQTFTLAAPPLIAGNWFGAHERATATAIGVLMNLGGVAVGLGVTIIIEFGGMTNTIDGLDCAGETSDTNSRVTTLRGGKGHLNTSLLQTYVGSQALFSLVAWLLVATIVSSDRPPTPPSAAADNNTYTKETNAQGDAVIVSSESTSLIHEDSYAGTFYLKEDPEQQQNPCSIPSTMNYRESVEATLCTRAAAFVPVFGLAIGVYYTIPAFLSQLTPLSWSARTNGWLGLTYVLSGLVGTFAMGRVLDRHPTQHRQIYQRLLVGALLSWLVVASVTTEVELDANPQLVPLQDISIFVATTITGFCLAAMISVGMEYATTMTYPADPAATAGLLECAAEGVGYALVRVGAWILPNEGEFHAVLLGMLALSLLWFSVLARNDSSKRPS